MTQDSLTRKRIPYVQVATAILDDRSLSRDARFLYVKLVEYADLKGRDNAFPGRKELAEQMDASPRSITRWIAELVDAGYLLSEARYRADGSRSSNDYTLLDQAYFPESKEERRRKSVEGFAYVQQIQDGRTSEGRDPWPRAAGESPF